MERSSLEEDEGAVSAGWASGLPRWKGGDHINHSGRKPKWS